MVQGRLRPTSRRSDTKLEQQPCDPKPAIEFSDVIRPLWARCCYSLKLEADIRTDFLAYGGCLLQNIMLGAPTTYFVRLAQAILYRGAGFDVIWRDLLAMTGVGACFFTVALLRFRKAVTQTQV